MSGRYHPFGGGVRAANDGRGTILPGDTASASTVFVVQGGDEVGVADSTLTDAEREGSRKETALMYHVPRRRAMHL